MWTNWDQITRDCIKAEAISICVVLSFLSVTLLFTAKRVWSSQVGRKWMHIIIGPLFIICWLLFPRDPSAKYYAVLIPTGIVIRFILLGVGILKDETTVRSMSRTGNATELLKGPLLYGVIILYCTVRYWTDSAIGIVTLLVLCIGDGFAGLIGCFFPAGKSNSLPWNHSKTWLGTMTFIVATFIISSIYLMIFQNYGYPVHLSISTLIFTITVSAFVESLPGQNDWDNITTPLASLVMLHLFVK